MSSVARRHGIHLHARDLAVLETLAARGVETLPWLHDRHFAGLSRKRARNRLGELVAHGYLTKHTVPGLAAEDDTAIERSDAVYVLAAKALAALRLRSLAGEQLRARVDPQLPKTSIPHQLAVNRVGDALNTPLIPEHLLELDPRIERRHRPDAAYR